MTQRSPRVRKGTLVRFDSVSELLAFSRDRYPTAEVRADNLDEEFVLQVRSARVDFESLIVHFDGEQTYAVMFPERSLLQQLALRLGRRG